jgi:putative intracellular protease/amidase
VRRIVVLAVLVLVGLGISNISTLEGQDSRVLMVVKDGPSLDLELMLTEEVGVMRNMLEATGSQVVVASPSGEPLVAGEVTLIPDIRLADAEMVDYVGIILPCMAVDEEPSLPAVEALVREAVVAGKPVAAQTGSVVTLARAGVLMGREYAYVEEWIGNVPEFEGLTYGGEGIVHDGDIITSGVCPYAAREQGLEDGTQALTGAFITHLWEKF